MRTHERVRYFYHHFSTLFFLFSSQCFFSQPLLSAMDKKDPSVRVLIDSEATKFFVSGVDMKRISLDGVIKEYKGWHRLSFKCTYEGQKKKMLGQMVQVFSLSSPSEVLTYKNKQYRGVLNIVLSRDRKKCYVINKLSIEVYLRSLLAREMNAKWPLEALKAQAVAARTYALYHIQHQSRSHEIFNHVDVVNSESFQVSGHLLDSDPKTVRAQQETKGLILRRANDNKLIETFYHAKCGGFTRLPSQVWKKDIDGFVSVKCDYCTGQGQKKWTAKISKDNLMSYVKNSYKKMKTLGLAEKKKLRFFPDTSFNSRAQMYVGDSPLRLKKESMRRFFGRSVLPSSSFYITNQSDDHVHIEGQGLGHGVGLCQVGAKFQALKGSNYREILKFYYPLFKLSRI